MLLAFDTDSGSYCAATNGKMITKHYLARNRYRRDLEALTRYFPGGSE
jgi:hypothetical protein